MESAAATMERASELVEARLAPSPITPQVAGASALPAMAQMVPMVSDVSGGVQPTAVRMRYQIAAYLAVGVTVLLILFVCAMLTRLVQSSGLDPHTSGLYPSGAPHCPRPLPYLWAVPLECSPLPASSAKLSPAWSAALIGRSARSGPLSAEPIARDLQARHSSRLLYARPPSNAARLHGHDANVDWRPACRRRLHVHPRSAPKCATTDRTHQTSPA